MIQHFENFILCWGVNVSLNTGRLASGRLIYLIRRDGSIILVLHFNCDICWDFSRCTVGQLVIWRTFAQISLELFFFVAE